MKRRVSVEPPSAPGSTVPRAFLVGRCIEVWAEPDNPISAMRRFNRARAGWLDRHGVSDDRAKQELVPHAAPWSVEFMLYRGHAEQVGRSTHDLVTERLARAGCTVEDVPALRREALALLEASTPGRSGV